ncbi:hypothetical protein ADEAN_000120700 [Angomonas deanei]|uniref:Uncharacterized protein n=1 Tax=Angomonas deanei TaxID=59799 RepID=A0A7G2C3D5_9TRYP|nr:hypothetical protein ADEAN_000120700 [Angomonas deanei]
MVILSARERRREREEQERQARLEESGRNFRLMYFPGAAAPAMVYEAEQHHTESEGASRVSGMPLQYLPGTAPALGCQAAEEDTASNASGEYGRAEYTTGDGTRAEETEETQEAKVEFV